MRTGRLMRLLTALFVTGWSAVLTSRIQAQGLAPEEAVKRMRVADGFEVRLVASEPLVRQPVCIEFDDRGRLWVIQYLQYPNPAGLKRVQVDRYSRTKYDRVPEPPPRGPRGADRITILEDTDGDGRRDRGRDFLDGLNLATGLAFGHGGVFVLNVPYLLFYPDRDRNDVPDGDPEVLLTGFGMEDAHSLANSLTWGPDGWLYGCQGSTVTANIRGNEFQQGVWRYHPVTHAFELFCEGGGNSWGLDFDRQGNLFYSTNYGGHVLLHGLQGGYFVKSFAKHGELHNRHSYGFFDHAPHKNFRGGHVTVGGIVYQGDSFPAAFRGKYVAGDLLGHGVYWHDIERHGSTVKTAHGGQLLVANDDWFAPTDVTLGPDGAVYVSDWYDGRTAHPDPDADWDRTNGRIYRISAKGTKPVEPIDFAKLGVEQLIELHDHPSQWHVRHARQELVRRHATVVPAAESRKRSEARSPAASGALTAKVESKLRDAALQSPTETMALEALWTLHALDRFDEELASQLLGGPHPAVRAWTVRLLGDSRQVSHEMAHRLDKFAEHEPMVEVRQQLAATAARLPAHQAMPIINANINRDIDNDDPRLPLLLWWAVERHSVDGRDEVLRRFLRPALWKSTLGRETLLSRLIRRYAAEESRAGLNSVVQLLKAAPDEAARNSLWGPVLQGWQERPPAAAAMNDDAEDTNSAEFSRMVLAAWQAQPADSTLLKLGIALRLPEPLDAVRRAAFDRAVDAGRRVTLLDMLGPTSDPTLIEPSLELVLADEPEAVRNAALRILSRFDDQRIISKLMALHRSSRSAALQSQIRDVLLGRKASARALLSAVDRGEIEAKVTPLEQIRRVALFEDADLDALVAKYWGRLEPSTREEKLAEVRRLNNDLRAAPGNAAAGHLVYKKHCASCHQLFGEGTKLGPELTSANRQDRDFLLISLVDPNSVIRKEFVNIVVQTKDGRVLTGLPASRNETGLTLVNAKNEPVVIPAAEIDELHESPVSMMPADLHRQLAPQDLRDLFSYLQRSE